MNEKIFKTFYSVIFILIFILNANAEFKSDIIGKVAITNTEIPHGFILGKIPGFAKKTLKGNPWLMDSRAIRKLTKRIYPGGDSNSVKDIHVTIMTTSKKPYGDDIVCYILLFKDGTKAKNEIKKMSDYVGYNSDRAMLLTKDNIAVFLHVDDVGNFYLLNGLANNIRTKLKGL